MDNDMIAALDAFKATQGENWKESLSRCWMNASYPSGLPDEHKAALQRLRNQHGPKWLAQQ